MTAGSGDDRDELSVWATGQQPSRIQRTGRYQPGSGAHPAKMLPALARHLIRRYTAPGDLIMDPMCGIGTSVVEAVHLGRHAIGVDYEPRWAAAAVHNLTLAATQGATGRGRILAGDSRSLPALLPDGTAGQVALVLTSPPYGAATHGQVDAVPGRGVHKDNWRYGTDRGNLAHAPLPDLLDGFTRILTGCAAVLRPGGTVAVTVRPYRHRGELVDLPGAVIGAADTAGLDLHDRAVALIAGLRDSHLTPRASFFALRNARAAQAAGIPIHVVAHEDVLLFRVAGQDGQP